MDREVETWANSHLVQHSCQRCENQKAAVVQCSTYRVRDCHSGADVTSQPSHVIHLLVHLPGPVMFNITASLVPIFGGELIDS
jgi:hypothetical protein